METIKIAWRLVVDIATGLVLFAALTAGAVGAHYVAQWGEQNGLDPIIVLELRFVEFTWPQRTPYPSRLWPIKRWPTSSAG